MYILEYDGAELTRQHNKPTDCYAHKLPSGDKLSIPAGSALWRYEDDPVIQPPTPEDIAAAELTAKEARDKRFAALRKASTLDAAKAAIETLLT